jgi:nicotinate-nucleotide pyrophosphorylase (carboxylating)
MTTSDISDDPSVRRIIHDALQEDIGAGDVTTNALIPPRLKARAILWTREPCVIAGATVAAAIFRTVNAQLQVSIQTPDGRSAGPGCKVMTIAGPARGILTAERVALNFIQRLSGIATLTSAYVQRIKPFHTRVLDTRKTTPGLRILEKYAVRCGGGTNHRMGLYDMVLMKDNHRFLWKNRGGLDAAIREARRRHPGIPIEIEVENIPELQQALRGKPDWIMLDNMTPALMRQCVKLTRHECRLEASGGVDLKRVRRIAATGVDAISIGRLTHSAPAIDLSLEIDYKASSIRKRP